MILEDTTSKYPSRSELADWSQPERSFKEKQKSQAREKETTCPGHPSTKESRHAVATNWFQPHLWSIIASEADFVPSMSPTELQNRLQKRHPVLFGHIRSQVLGRMMATDKDRKRVWSDHTIQQVKQQNGHDGHSTQHGVLVRGSAVRSYQVGRTKNSVCLLMQDDYPEVKSKIVECLQCMRDLGVPLPLIGVKARIIAMIHIEAKESCS
jgi:hypothetical protein